MIVDKDLLLMLFSTCQIPGCGSLVDKDDLKIKVEGAAVSIEATCVKSHEYKWSSSTKVGEHRRQMFRVNIELASYVVLCGLDISQVIKNI